MIDTINEETDYNKALRNSKYIKAWDFSSRDKDLYEAIGFQNGRKPWTDCRGVGLMGINLLISFFENINKAHMLFCE